jgi:hypothetical protein
MSLIRHHPSDDLMSRWTVKLASWGKIVPVARLNVACPTESLRGGDARTD